MHAADGRACLDELHWLQQKASATGHFLPSKMQRSTVKEAQRPAVRQFLDPNSALNFTIKKEILYHIKMPINAWSTKCR
jgi:hypothetical protein